MARRANRPASNRQKVQKSRTAETLEPRVVMSANPIGGPMFGTHSVVDDMPAMTQHQAPTLEQHSFAPVLDQSGLESTAGHDPDADFWLGAGSSVDLLEDLDRQIEQNLREGHALTGQDDVVDTYGFKGTGQTVAVIDSGIAYNHFALGGGMGEGYRVVGGWDFTENDADFYDDGPSKSAAHGTHVAGIVGAAGGGTHQGVATDVDLVGLRVFDDAGNGYFSWVEQALQWVHTNRDAFDNPITAVNLSLGVEQNSTSVPGWSMLEDEFAQLEADGIFISVSAGNSFTSYNAKGLSYPASSPHVIPVMASSNDGTLAPFSQRHESAIAAPGRWITSTVPDYAANDGDTIDDDYLSMSGTSMASPYVAGASVLIREAMEFARQDANHTDSWGDIDQWDIYNHMIDTAVTFTDSATSTDFKRLDLKAAIDAIIPEDDFGSTIATAHNLGTLNDTSSATPLSMISGSITTLDDADHFSFTAGVSGVVTISAANASHALTASWEAWGGTWSTNEAGDCVIEVVAGESYRVGLSSSNGLGYYDLDVSVESTFAAVEWGAISAQETRSWQPSSNETWFAVTAGRTGYFTAETLTDSGSASVAIYDAQQNLVATAGTRADVQATAGETLMLRVTGDASSFDLRMTNALSLSGSTATMVGTDGEDAITFSAGSSSHTVSLNGVDYSLSASAYDSITIDGAGGGDTLRFNGTSASETAALRVGSLSIVGQQYQLDASGYENAIVLGGGGNDTATLFDGLTDDRLVARGNGVTLYAANGTFSNTAKGFSRIDASSSEGLDFAYLNGSEASDVFSAVGSEAFMRGEDDSYDNRTYGFDRVFADAGRGGADIAYFADTDSNDVLSTSSDHTLMRDTVGSYYNYATGFSVVHASSIRGGNDYAYLSDSAVNDVFLADSDRAIIRAADNSYTNTANGFDRVFAYSNAGGSDLAYFTDSVGDDTYSGRENSALMTDADSSYYNLATGFSRAFAYSSNGGHDRAHLYDSASADTFIARATYSQLYATDLSYYHRADGFDRVYAYAVRGGNDRAYLYGSAGADIFKGWSSHSVMRANDWSSYYYALGFDSVTAVADPGQGDFAVLYDSPGNDQLTAEGGTAVLSGSSYANEARGFDTVRAVQQNGGDDSASIDEDSLEFAFEQYGSWD